MSTTSEELKKLYKKLGGDEENIRKASTPAEILNGINELDFGSAIMSDAKIEDLKDVEIVSPVKGETIEFDGEKWVNVDKPDMSVSKSVSGNPVEFNDGANAPLVKCVTEIQGSQDLHGYDKPWVGGAGKNKLPNALLNDQSSITFEGVVMTVEGNGFHFQGTATNNGGRLNLTTKHITLPAGTYAFSYSRNIIDAFVESGNNIIASLLNPVFTLEESTEVYVGFNVVGGRTYNETSLVQIESGSTPTTFAPYSNICPITAYTEGKIEVRGKNLLVNDFEQGAISSTDGKTYADNKTSNATRIRVADLISLNPNETYTISCDFTKYRIVAQKYDENGISVYPTSPFNVWAESAFQVTGTYNIAIAIKKISEANITPSDYADVKPQIEKGSTATPYEPYTSTTHTTTYPSAIYRGSEDCVKGEVTNDMPAIDLGDLTWDKSNITPNAFFATLPGYKFDSNVIMLCSAYNYVGTTSTGTPSLTTKPDGSFMAYYKSGDNYREIYFKDTRFTEATDFANAVDGVMIAYELATPTTSSVTPTNLPIKSLSGYNHIESSTGDMDIDYINGAYDPLIQVMSKQVVANPTDAASETLTGLKVGDTTYSVPQGGGGSIQRMLMNNTITIE